MEKKTNVNKALIVAIVVLVLINFSLHKLFVNISLLIIYQYLNSDILNVNLNLQR